MADLVAGADEDPGVEQHVLVVAGPGRHRPEHHVPGAARLVRRVL